MAPGCTAAAGWVPADVAGTAFLLLEQKGGGSDQYIYLPGLRRTRRIVGRERLCLVGLGPEQRDGMASGKSAGRDAAGHIPGADDADIHKNLLAA